MVINGNEETLNASVINYNAKLALYDPLRSGMVS